MKIRICAVGKRPPDWVSRGWQEYAQRLPAEFCVELVEIKPAARSRGGPPIPALLALEAQRLRAALPARARMVALDEHGADWTTAQLAAALQTWSCSGRDVAFLIGGADGLDADLKAQADECLRLSSLTLPHALVRVILAEALYRAVSLIKGHPYHRA